MAYQISDACTGCGLCLPECPTGSILEGTDRFHIDADTCAEHALCVNVCPENAISPRKPELPPKPSHAKEEEALDDYEI